MEASLCSCRFKDRIYLGNQPDIFEFVGNEPLVEVIILPSVEGLRGR